MMSYVYSYRPRERDNLGSQVPLRICGERNVVGDVPHNSLFYSITQVTSTSISYVGQRTNPDVCLLSYRPCNQVCRKDDCHIIVGIEEYYDMWLLTCRSHNKVCRKEDCCTTYRQCTYICVDVKQQGGHTVCDFSLMDHMTQYDTARMILVPHTFSPICR